MTFEREVRGYLEHVERDVRVVPRHRRIDESALRKQFLEELQRLESRNQPVNEIFREWSPKLSDFARYLEALPPEVAPVDGDPALQFARKALVYAMLVRDDTASVVERLELGRIVDSFIPLEHIEQYALESLLVRREQSGHLSITGLGRAFLRLRGKDAIRWLLTVEVQQCRGPRDPWHASRELLKLASSSDGILGPDEFEGEYSFAFHIATLERLRRLAVLRFCPAWADTRSSYQIDSSMGDVVEWVLEAGPWDVMVAALLEDERAILLPLRGPGARDAVIAQTRLITHEVRNALIPVRHHLDAMLKAKHIPQRERLDAARRGVVRVLSFVDEMVATSEIADEPPASIEVGDVLRGALSWLDGGERVELDLPIEVIKLRGRRSPLQRAVSNVMLNALQATSPGQRVIVRVRRSAGRIEIVVDDGGPGVPEESRTIVFHDGFTTRGGAGGSGFGLAYVRRVVDDLQGRVWCEASDLGGARFVMELPEGEADQ